MGIVLVGSRLVVGSLVVPFSRFEPLMVTVSQLDTPHHHILFTHHTSAGYVAYISQHCRSGTRIKNADDERMIINAAAQDHPIAQVHHSAARGAKHVAQSFR